MAITKLEAFMTKHQNRGAGSPTYNNLSAACAATRQMVWKWKSGQSEPGARKACKIVQYLRQWDPDLTVEDLFS